MPSKGYKRRTLYSKCCQKRVKVRWYFTVLVGECHGCGEIVMRVNPETRRQEWLELGQDPLTTDPLELVTPGPE